jgi:hypothetical protein
MKTITILLLLLLTIETNAQVSVNYKLGASILHRTSLFTGIEIQGSNISASLEFRPDYMDKHIYANGVGLFTTLYLWTYKSTPFFTMGIVTHGSVKDEITGKPVRSMPIFMGYRFYPKDKWNFIDEDMSFDIGLGAELMRNSTVRTYIQVSGNYILFKYR